MDSVIKKINSNKIVSLFMVFIICLGILTSPLCQPKAEAFAITASATATLITIMALAGISFASLGIAKEVSEELMRKDPGLYDSVNEIANNMPPMPPGDPPANKFIMDTSMTGAVAYIFNRLKSVFGNIKNNGSVEVVDPNLFNLNNANIVTNFSDLSSSQLYELAQYPFNFYSTVYGDSFDSTKSIQFKLNGDLQYNYFFFNNPNNSDLYSLFVKREDGKFYFFQNGSDYVTVDFGGWHDNDLRLGFYVQSVLNNGEAFRVMPYLAWSYYNSTGQRYYKTYTGSTYEHIMTVYPTELGTHYNNVPYQNISPYELNIIYGALAEKLKEKEITFDYTEILEKIQSNQEEQLSKSQDDYLRDAEIIDTLEDIKAREDPKPSQPDDPPRPGIMPRFGNIWDYVKNFLNNALIWMKLWFSGFVLLPNEIQTALWALVVITIVIGLLGVIL